MGIKSAFSGKNRSENSILLAIFAIVFVILILQPPLYSPDTYSYLRADISRFPGYILFLRSLQFLFKSSFDVVAVAVHLIFSFIAIIVFYKKMVGLLFLKVFSKIALLAVLILPFFPPFEIANNLTSEGLAYPLYILLIAFATELIFIGDRKKILHVSLIFFALALTRGQFIVVGPIIAFMLLLKLKKATFRRGNILLIALLLLLPVFSGLLDSSYRKLFYGHFIKTPYSYVNAITLPLFVSEAENINLIATKAHKDIFKMSYERIDSLKLLSSKVNGSYNSKYMVFHEHFPQICNQNIHAQGKAYYYALDQTPHLNSIRTEEACKAMFPVLLKANFKEWAAIYFAGIVHGFQSVFALFFMIVLAILSLWKVLRKFSRNNGFILFSTLLLLSNAMIVAVASHSIQRYLFYNYALALLIILILLKKLKSRYES